MLVSEILIKFKNVLPLKQDHLVEVFDSKNLREILSWSIVRDRDIGSS